MDNENLMEQELYVIKREGYPQRVSKDKIFYRLQKIKDDKDLGSLKNIDVLTVASEVASKICNNITTEELDEEAGRIAIGKCSEHPEYSTLAARIVISNMHKKTTEMFSDVMEELYKLQQINIDVIKVVRQHKYKLNFAIDYKRDYLFDYFGYKTLERSYLLKDKEQHILERPQHLYMRVALGIHKGDIDKVLQSYHLMSQGYFTHATPTLFNSGKNNPQMSSCYLMIVEDSMEGICKCWTWCAMVSKWAGGIAVDASKIRPKGTLIRGTNGQSDGIVQLLRVYNEIARYSNQGGKRKGSIALYLQPWHGDIMEFLELRLNTGEDHKRARDLFYALWTPDLFMKAVEKDEDWYLMSEDDCPGLTDSYGDEFEKLYKRYISEGKYLRVVKAQEIWKKLIIAQIEAGMPYMAFKDHVNRKSNQKNIGPIKSLNLCAEVSLYADKDEVAVCNIATFSLPKYVEDLGNGDKTFNHKKLYEVVKITTDNMNKIIDGNYYPIEEAKRSNMRHRPIALGIQGLANCFFEMGYPYESEDAKKLNREIMETIYYASLEASMELAQKDQPYETFKGSPFSQGILQFDMWNNKEITHSGRYDWDNLKEQIKKYGTRNSMLTSLPPTASTSQILGNYESFEPVTNNIMTRTVLSGTYTVVNKYLINDLIKLHLWTPKMKDQIIANNGSIQNIKEIPDNIKKLYKTIWEIPQKVLVDLSLDRAVYIDQTQSLNIYLADPTYQQLTSLHFYTWKNGAKTGMYYLRSRPAVDPQKFTLSTTTNEQDQRTLEEQKLACSIDNREACQMCSG